MGRKVPPNPAGVYRGEEFFVDDRLQRLTGHIVYVEIREGATRKIPEPLRRFELHSRDHLVGHELRPDRLLQVAPFGHAVSPSPKLKLMLKLTL